MTRAANPGRDRPGAGTHHRIQNTVLGVDELGYRATFGTDRGAGRMRRVRLNRDKPAVAHH